MRLELGAFLLCFFIIILTLFTSTTTAMAPLPTPSTLEKLSKGPAPMKKAQTMFCRRLGHKFFFFLFTNICLYFYILGFYSSLLPLPRLRQKMKNGPQCP